MSPLRHHFLKLAGLRELTKLDEALAKLWSYRQSGLLAGGNHAENMRQVWRTSDILRSRFKQPPTLDEAFNHVGGLLRKGEVGGVAKNAAALPYKDGELTGELADLAHVVKKKRLGDIPEAIDEVAYAGQRWYGKTFDSKRRLTGTKAKKVRQRAAVWRNMFARHHIPFSPHYLTSGDDFSNPTAVRNAFLAAGKQIDDNEALQMSVRMSDAYKVNTGELDVGLQKTANMALRKLIREWRKAPTDMNRVTELLGTYGHNDSVGESLLRFIIKKNPTRDLRLVAPDPKIPNASAIDVHWKTQADPGQFAVVDKVMRQGLAEGDNVLVRPSVTVKNLEREEWDAFGKNASAASIATQLRNARNKTHTHPTPGQAHAGNYAKGSLILHGMAVKLENPNGTERRGYDKDGNITWRRTMQADYGYFQGTKAVDGDAVDCFIGPDIESHFVLAVDQMKSDGSFDETKFILGCTSQERAEKLYLAHYPRGWNLGPTSTTTVQQLKAWLKAGDTKSPFKGQMVKAADWQNTCPECGAEGTYGGEREKPSKELCYKCAEASAPKCEHGINVPFNTCDQGCKAPIEKSAVVKQDDETGKWILWTRDKKRKLGTHDTPEEAYAQEYAIQKSQEARSEFSLSKAASAPTFSSHLDSPKYFGRPGSRVTSSMLLASANRNGIDPRLLAAVAANESKWGTHRNATSANNFTGMMGNGNELFRYDTPQDGLDAAAKLLKRRYIAKGLDTPEKIGPVYAPTENATNDPNGINNNWVPTVSSILKRIPSPAGGRAPAAPVQPVQPVRPTWVRGSLTGPGLALPSLPTRPVVVQGSMTGQGTVMPTFAKNAAHSAPKSCDQLLHDLLAPREKSAKERVSIPDYRRRLSNMAERRGECIECGKPNRDGIFCECGETKSWASYPKQASLASAMKKAGPYLGAAKEMLVGSKLPASTFPDPVLPVGAENISQLLPKVISLLRLTITGSPK